MSSTSSFALPSPTSTSLGFGMVPDFPQSLLLSDSVAINCVLAEIPFFIVGVLGFALVTFFISVRQINKFVLLAAAASKLEFFGALLDLIQLLERGNNVQTGTDVTKVQAIIIVREVLFSLAPGVIFLFYWFYVALPPRGELERPYGGRSYSRALGIVTYEGAYHSGRWDRWGYVGRALQWILLGAVTATPVLQAAWRTTQYTVSFSPLYNASATLEIILASLFILKLLGNTYMAVNLPQGRTFRDYIPIIASLAFILGVSIGNTITFKFSETILGRFLQAVQLYIIIIYTMISTFYKVSFEEPLPSDKAPTPFGGIGVNINRSSSTFHITPPTVSTPDLATAIRSNRRTSYYRASRSTITRFSSWLNRGLSNRDEEPGMVERQDDESDILPITDRKARGMTDYFDQKEPAPFSQGVPLDEKNEYVAPPLPRPVQPTATAASATIQPLTIGRKEEDPFTSETPTSASITAENQTVRPPPSIGGDTATMSPVFGLRGIIRGDEKSSSRSSKDSDLSSLIRQQAELDKSVAGLQLYSDGADRASRLTMGISPTQSDFSLSRFPEPPFALSGNNNRRSDISVSVAGDDFVVDDVEFTLVPPSMPVAASEAGNSKESRITSFPASNRGSEFGSIVANGRNPMYDSNGTQYDVTSFIGGLTAPTPSVTTAREPMATIVSDDEGMDTSLSNPRPAPAPPTTRAINTLPLNPRPGAGQSVTSQAAVPQPLILRSGIQTIRPTEPELLQVPKKSNLKRPQISAPKIIRASLDQNAAYERPRQPPAGPPTSFK